MDLQKCYCKSRNHPFRLTPVPIFVNMVLFQAIVYISLVPRLACEQKLLLQAMESWVWPGNSTQTQISKRSITLYLKHLTEWKNKLFQHKHIASYLCSRKCRTSSHALMQISDDAMLSEIDWSVCCSTYWVLFVQFSRIACNAKAKTCTLHGLLLQSVTCSFLGMESEPMNFSNFMTM